MASDYGRLHGTVSAINLQKKFGFLEPVGGGNGVFFDISAMDATEFESLRVGTTVVYEPPTDSGRGLRTNYVQPLGS